jgi:hypothetical protein
LDVSLPAGEAGVSLSYFRYLTFLILFNNGHASAKAGAFSTAFALLLINYSLSVSGQKSFVFA